MYKGLPKGIYALFFARIINSMGAFVFPFLTIFLTRNLGLDEKTAGSIVMIGAFFSVPGSFLGGFLSDYIGRKKIIILAQGLAALCFVPCAFLEDSMIIPVLLMSSNFFAGIARPATTAMTTDLTNKDNRKAAFSLIYLGINIGFSIGPLIAGFLYNNYIELIFLGDAFTTLLSLIFVYKYVDETKPTEKEIEDSKVSDNTQEKAEEGSLVAVLLKRPNLIFFGIASVVYSFVFAQHGFSLPLQTESIFNNDLSTEVFGTLMATNGIVVVLMTVFLIDLTKKLKPLLNIAMAGILCGIGFGMIYYVSSIKLLILSTVIWTLGEILNATNTGVYIANHTPISHRGRFNSIFPIITGAGFALSPRIMGSFINLNGIRAVWPLIFCLSMIGALLMFLLYVWEKTKKQKVYEKKEV
ncbi:MAG: MFS transporter [Firmicutes bacterium]|nr:MFS transporter [Bacillota bacterium]